MIDSVLFERPCLTGAYRLPCNSVGTICLGYGDEDNLLLNGVGHAKLGEFERHPTCPTSVKRGATLVGWSVCIVHVVRSCICNCHNAICNRHGRAMPPATRNLNHVFHVFEEAIRGCDAEALLSPYSNFDYWNSRWPLGKRKAVLRSIAMDPVQYDRIKAFIKTEVYTKVPKRGRLIQCSPNFATQAATGPQCAALQKAVFSRLNRYKLNSRIDITIASGMNANAIGDWMNWVVSMGAVIFYERDGACWDSTMQEMHANFRQDLYATLDVGFADAMRKQNHVKGGCSTKDGYLPYSVRFTVKSGQNDTSFGNGLVNGGITFAVLNQLKYRASMIVAGDDLLVALYEKEVDVEAIMGLEREYGISPEAAVFYDPSHVSFISGIFMFDSKRYHFLPSPGRLLSRLWWAVHAPDPKNLSAYIRGVAKGLVKVVSGLPVLELLIGKFDSDGDVIKTDKGYLFKNSANEFDPGVRDYFRRRYGITESELLDVEEYMSGLPVEPLILVHPVLDRIVEIDTADITVRGVGVWTNATGEPN